jgi:hypothetical protein
VNLLPRADELGRVPPDAPGKIDSFSAPDSAEPGSRSIRRGERVVVDGWCADPTTLRPPAKIAIVLADRVIAAAGGIARPDVVAALGGTPDSAGYGFVAVVDTTGVPLGTHVARVVLQASDGSWRVVRDGVTLEIEPSGAGGSIARAGASRHVHLDPPVRARDGAPAATAGENEMVIVSGWALDDDLRPGRSVAVAVDGSIIGEAAYGLPRPDVREHFAASAAADMCGFHFRVRAGRLGGPGRRAIHAVLRAGDGSLRIAGAAVTINVTKADPIADALQAVRTPAARFDEARAVRADGTVAAAADPLRVQPGEVLVLRGWAVDAERRSDPSRLFLILDGSLPIEAPSGLARPDIYETLGYGSRSGFEVAVPLDGLTPGPHTIEAYIGSADGSELAPAGARVDFVVG